MLDLDKVKADVSAPHTSGLKKIAEQVGQNSLKEVIDSINSSKQSFTSAYCHTGTGVIRELETKRKVNEAIISASETNQQLVVYAQERNQQLMAINRGLETTNKNLSKQLQEINNNVDFIINTIGTNAQISEEQQKENQKLLIELAILLKTKDETGFKMFIEKNIGNGIGIAGLILQAMSML
nr:hypothetical protein [uncultured Cellulosilyticum sp.]